MNVMYIKYNSKNRESIIKDGEKLSKIITPINKNMKNKELSSVINIDDFKNYKQDLKDEEITNFFFNSVHKNYLKNR